VFQMSRKRLPRKPKVERGYYLIPKTEFPPKDVLHKLPLKKLNLKKFRRKKNG
jgi:hypothetical protein